MQWKISKREKFFFFFKKEKFQKDEPQKLIIYI